MLQWLRSATRERATPAMAQARGAPAATAAPTPRGQEPATGKEWFMPAEIHRVPRRPMGAAVAGGAPPRPGGGPPGVAVINVPYHLHAGAGRTEIAPEGVAPWAAVRLRNGARERFEQEPTPRPRDRPDPPPTSCLLAPDIRYVDTDATYFLYGAWSATRPIGSVTPDERRRPIKRSAERTR